MLISVCREKLKLAANFLKRADTQELFFVVFHVTDTDKK
ncbi:hypothetical protein SIAM614_03685 [Roseibium aggregatum IAM 12614]|uniref:Uncharacterized protein n=1 Tax=Roseibium aggregatum (strain ATCC 25650 / DSM 13394 / JCM 20685 / NBRC 16684 / NCIMB 2208 / IAM 12614 / B1) TaxID=384765 RepID=A0NRT1_ROSAI|nr:hypothetical protein SIAM614_03685 [Roseibium aggregatum IAM 12614]